MHYRRRGLPRPMNFVQRCQIDSCVLRGAFPKVAHSHSNIVLDNLNSRFLVFAVANDPASILLGKVQLQFRSVEIVAGVLVWPSKQATDEGTHQRCYDRSGFRRPVNWHRHPFRSKTSSAAEFSPASNDRAVALSHFPARHAKGGATDSKPAHA